MKTHLWKKTGAGLLIGALVIGVAGALVYAQEKTETAPKIPQPNAAISSGTNADGITTPFENKTNHFEDQDAFDKDRQAFEDVETIKQEKVCKPKEDEDKAAKRTGGKPTPPGERPTCTPSCTPGDTKGGLGPVYNATSCAVCHQNPITGAASQVSEIRAGHIETFASGNPNVAPVAKFVEPLTGSLIHQRATNPKIQESVPREETSRTFRMTTNVLGDGFVEVLADTQITAVQKQQPDGLKGLPVVVAVTVKRDKSLDEKPDRGFVHQFRIGRFGWKCQHASLLNFSADAYINEMGITSPLQDKENKSNSGTEKDLKEADGVLFDPEEYDDKPRPPQEAKTEDPFEEGKHSFGEDVGAFARFMRATNPPPRGTVPTDPNAPENIGKRIFWDEKSPTMKQEGTRPIQTLACAICHRPSFQKPKRRSLIVALAAKGATPPPGSDIDILKTDGTVALEVVADENKIHSAVPDALGRDPSHPDKDRPNSDSDPDFIFPYSDFMMHDIGTGDGIAQTQHAQIEPVGLRNGRLNELLKERLMPKDETAAKSMQQEANENSILPPERFQMTDSGLLPLQDSRNLVPPSGDIAPLVTTVRVLNAEKAKPGTVRRELDQTTTNMVRTAPLWGLRTRPQLMHDGLSLTIDDAIQRHKVRAVYRLKDNAGNDVGPTFEVNLPQNFDDLNQDEKKALRAFLKSL